MKKYKNFTIDEYLKVLSKREPVPGGGSASAVTGALGVSLLSMVANYSLGRDQPKRIENKIEKILKQSEELRVRLLELADLDAMAYLGVVKARGKTAKEKNAAHRETKKVSREICRLCYKAVGLSSYLVENGNKYLISDVEAANEMLLAAFNSSLNFLKY